MDRVLSYVLLFFFYSFLGWCVEVTLKFIQYRRFINRGFLTGPVCPIYGAGALLITLAVRLLAPVELAYGTTFALSFVLCGSLEYFTSFLQEKLFNARWWDYSKKPMNLNGRVWIGNLVLFGIAGVLIIKVGNPLYYRLEALMPLKAMRIMVCAKLAVFAADAVYTHFILKLVNAGIKKSEADNTEEIRSEIKLLISDRNLLYRRFVDAYPEVIYRTERINERLKAIRLETERLRQEAEKQYKQVARALEPAALTRNRIIEMQGELISALYDEHSASEKNIKLKHEIDDEIKRLNGRVLVKAGGGAPAADGNSEGETNAGRY